MPLDDLSHFDEKSGVIFCTTPWGRWWQTVHEIHIEVNLPENTRGKEVSVKVFPNEINCIVRKETIFKGPLFRTVHPDETVWTIEDSKLLNIVLAKADVSSKDEIWESLLRDSFKPDLMTLHEMRKKIDLERFQIENPGFDFSRAKLSKTYDRVPGWSQEVLNNEEEEKKEEKATEEET